MGIVDSHCFEWLKTGSEALGGTPVQLLPGRIVYIGLRDVDKGEIEILERFNITTFTMIDVGRFGIREVMRRAVQAVDPEGDSPLPRAQMYSAILRCWKKVKDMPPAPGDELDQG
ncbi:MAG: arginase family protein [Gammaproteobacteria bacterium]